MEQTNVFKWGMIEPDLEKEIKFEDLEIGEPFFAFNKETNNIAYLGYKLMPTKAIFNNQEYIFDYAQLSMASDKTIMLLLNPSQKTIIENEMIKLYQTKPFDPNAIVTPPTNIIVP